MASPETLLPNGDDSGWTSGTFEDINNGISTPSGVALLTTVNPDTLILDVTDSEVVDGDTVTNITIDMRARVTGIGAKDDLIVDLLIGGSPQGTAVTHTSVGTSYSTLSANDSGWNVDRSASEMDGLQVRIATLQRGKGEPATYEIDELEVIVTFTSTPSDTLQAQVWM